MKCVKIILLSLLLCRISFAEENKFNQIKEILADYIPSARFTDALELLNNYQKNQPTDYRVYVEIAGVYKAMNDYNSAKKTYKQGIEIITNKQAQSQLYYESAMFNYKIGAYRNVVYDITKFTNLVPFKAISEKGQDYHIAYKVLGISYFLLFDYINAINSLNIYKTLNFQDEETYKFLSAAYYKTSDINYYSSYSEIFHYLKGTEKVSDKILYYQMGALFFKYSKYNDARDSLFAIYEEKRMDPKFNFNLGLTCFLAKDNVQSLKYLEKAVKLYEKKLSIIKMFNKIFRTDKTGAKYLLALAMVYHINHKTKESIETFEKINQYNSSEYKKKQNFKGYSSEVINNELANLWEK